jgi:hypothetical protein
VPKPTRTTAESSTPSSKRSSNTYPKRAPERGPFFCS